MGHIMKIATASGKKIEDILREKRYDYSRSYNMCTAYFAAAATKYT